MSSTFSMSYWVIGVLVIIVLITMWLIVTKKMHIASREDAVKMGRPLETGWMFYSKPTTLEPPGTIFRIDAQKTKYIVGELKVQVQKGKEVFGKSQERIQASMGVLAKILGVNVNINLGGRRAEQLEFEMTDPARETVMDMEIDLALKPFLEKLEYRTDNRYF